jgi:hypothetical protein
MKSRTVRWFGRMRVAMFAAYALLGLGALVGWWWPAGVSAVLLGVVIQLSLAGRGPRGRERPLDLDARRIGGP